MKPSKEMRKPTGEWNHIVITSNKNIIEVELNGEKVTRMNTNEWTKANKRPDGTTHKFDIAYKDHPVKGYIGLQDHGSPCWFRNIKIKPLKINRRTVVTSKRQRYVMIRSTLTVLLVYGCLAGNSYAQPGGAKPSPKPDEPPPKGLRVFFASHSLMWYAPKPLGEMAAAAGIKDHKLVGLQSLGASKTLQHWKLPDDKNQAKKALKTGEVDVFVMSPISFPDEGIENFIKLGLEHNPDMRFVVQLSWGGGDIDNQDFPTGAFDQVDKEKTPDQLKKLYEKNIKAGEAQADEINKKYGKGKKIVALVPTHRRWWR